MLSSVLLPFLSLLYSRPAAQHLSVVPGRRTTGIFFHWQRDPNWISKTAAYQAVNLAFAGTQAKRKWVIKYKKRQYLFFFISTTCCDILPANSLASSLEAGTGLAWGWRGNAMVMNPRVVIKKVMVFSCGTGAGFLLQPSPHWRKELPQTIGNLSGRCTGWRGLSCVCPSMDGLRGPSVKVGFFHHKWVSSAWGGCVGKAWEVSLRWSCKSSASTLVQAFCPVKATSALKQQLKQTLARECSEVLPAYSPSCSEWLTLSSLFELTTESKTLPFSSGMRAGGVTQLLYFRTRPGLLLPVQPGRLGAWQHLLMFLPQSSTFVGQATALHTLAAVRRLSFSAHKRGFSQHAWLGTRSGARNTSWKHLSTSADSARSLKGWLWPRWDSSPVAESWF